MGGHHAAIDGVCLFVCLSVVFCLFVVVLFVCLLLRWRFPRFRSGLCLNGGALWVGCSMWRIPDRELLDSDLDGVRRLLVLAELALFIQFGLI